MSKQGPTLRTIPQQTERVCNDCEYLETQAGVRGHRHCTNSFACLHPDINTGNRTSFNMKGVSIHYGIEGSCTTPDWCPFLNKKQNEKDNTTS